MSDLEGTGPDSWWTLFRRRRSCFHHDRYTGTSWIEEQLINLGSQKLLWCKNCTKKWVL